MKKLFALLSFAFLFACSSDDSVSISDSEDTASDVLSSDSLHSLYNKFWDLDSVSITNKDAEFFYNYALLKNNYLKASDELLDLADYYYLGDGYATSYSNTYAMYQSMSERYTYYIPPEITKDLVSVLFGVDSEIGIGIEIDSTMRVTQVYKGSPAYEAGITRGDFVTSIDDIAIVKEETFERLLSGSEGDEITLSLLRGDSAYDVTLTLSEIILPSVFVDSVENVPVIRITGFEEEAAGGSSSEEFEAALLETAGAKATIIDLRDNHGGSVDECLSAAEMLLLAGDTLILVDEASYSSLLDSQVIVREVIGASSNGIGADRYYVFLTDSLTASCAETFMVAVTSNKKSPVIGLSTYGKGIATIIGQTLLNGIFSMTNMQFYDKSGQTYHMKGLLPDYETADTDEAFAKALEFIEVNQTREAGFGSVNKERFLKKSLSTKSIERGGAYKHIDAKELLKMSIDDARL